jgi:hypothetical protein
VREETLEGEPMARKRQKRNAQSTQIVTFSLEDRTYQIDPDRGKVYRRFVQIETAKASQIISLWRASHVGA